MFRKIPDLKLSSEQIFFENWRWVPLRWLSFNNSALKIFSIYVPREQRFLFYMVFSIYEVVCVSCLSRSWQTKYATNKRRERLPKCLKPCEKRLLTQTVLFLGYRNYIKNKTQTAVINVVNFDRIFYEFDASYASQHIFSKVI